MRRSIHMVLACLMVFFVAVRPCPAASDPAQVAPGAAGAGAMTDIHDIRDIRAPGPDLRPLAYGLAALAAAALAALLAILWKRRRRLKGGVASSLPPDAVALSALDELSDVGGIDGRLFYFRLSAVLRRYLHGRFGIPAPEMTTEELLAEMDHPEIGRDRAASLARFFSDAAPITYAGRPAAVDRMQKDLDFARGFVRETAPLADAAPATGHGTDG